MQELEPQNIAGQVNATPMWSEQVRRCAVRANGELS
jgi:hypothetical protein